MDLAPGQKLGPYEILAAIGAGGMGEVWKARDPRLDRIVAIKISQSHFSERFEREARSVAALNHPNICQIYDVGPDYLVMEFVDGHTLAARIKEGALPLDEALPVARQIAEALEAAHEKGIVHRDLKPANVMITPQGTVKVLDFGLAKVEQPAASPDPANSPTITIATQGGLILGTAGYMSPEQAAGKPVDRRADIWAFGVVLYEMLAGRTLFSGETISHTLADVLRGEIDLKPVPAPANVKQLLRRCLDRDLRNRLQAIGEARIALQQPLADEPPPVVAKQRTGWWAAIVFAAALIVLAAVHFRESPPTPARVTFSVYPPEGTVFVGSGPPAVSPDGTRVAFVAGKEEKSQLWVHDFDQRTNRAIAGTDSPFGPFWSPDGQSLGFFAGGRLKRVDLRGGPPQVLADAPSGRGGTWNKDGVIVFTPSTRDSLYQVPAGGGSVQKLTTLDPALHELTHRFPWFLPDGRHFLFEVRGEPALAAYVGELTTGKAQRLMDSAYNVAYAAPGFLLSVREQSLMATPFDPASRTPRGQPTPYADPIAVTPIDNRAYFSVSQTGVLAYYQQAPLRFRQMTWYGREGSVMGLLARAGDVRNPAISPDGNRVLYLDRDLREGGNYVWLSDIARNIGSRLTTTPSSEDYPRWSPDGSQIVFAKLRSPGVYDLYRLPAFGGTAPGQVLTTENSKFPEDWSRDGRFLVYRELNPKRGLDLWVRPDPGGNPGKPFPFLETEHDETYARFSPDGKWIAYCSDESGKFEVYIQAFPSHTGKVQVSNGGGRHPVWNNNGSEIFYLAADRKLMAVDVKGGSPLAVGTPRALFQTRADSASSFAVTADGKRFLLADIAEQTSSVPMTVVLNWTAGLKK